MPTPTSVSEFLDLTQRSGVVDEARLTAYIQQVRAANALPTEPNRLAGMMVRDSLLTDFQAKQLLMGKWKRFTIGRYKVLEKIGVGGMGQVFLCEHILMRRRVAVKVLPTAKAEEASSLERFKREARAVASLDHPNIVRAYDLDQEDNLHFLVMEFVDGSNLQDIVKTSGPMPPLRACHYVYQAALGLQHAFDRAGLIHRDIKPGNILVDRTGVVKILDMGLARFFHDEDDLLTKKYDENVLGTADYLAPEQALDSHSVDIRADIYSLGATMYFMLTGNPPFVEGTVTQKLIWHQQKEPKPVSEFRSDVPAAILAILHKMMAKDPNNRFQVPSELADALWEHVQTPIPPPPDVEMPKLSPAAMGVVGGLPAPAPLPKAAGPTTPPPVRAVVSAEPTVVHRPATPAPINNGAPVRPVAAVAAPSVTQTAAAEDSAQVWSQITSETQSPVAADTAVSRPVYKPPSTTVHLSKSQRQRFASLQRGNRKWLWIGGAVAAALIALAIIVAAASHWNRDQNAGQPPPAPPEAKPTVWVVDAAAPVQGSSVQKIYQALAKAKPGDRILVRNDIRELWKIDWKRVKGISIESDAPAGKPLTWRLPAEIKAQKSILDLTEAEEIKIKGFIFDGENKVDHGIYMAFRCPGVVVEDVHFANCVKSGVMLSNAVGESTRPISFRRVRVQGHAKALAGITLFARPNFTPSLTQFVQIEDCVFDGPAATALTIDGPVDDIVFDGNRVFRAVNGVMVKAPTADSEIDVQLQSNTFHSLGGHAIYFDSVPAGAMVVEQNYFANCKLLVGVKGNKPLPKLTSTANARNAASAEGPVKLNADVVEQQFLVLDPNAGKAFLRYPKGSPLDNRGVGAPPRE